MDRINFNTITFLLGFASGMIAALIGSLTAVFSLESQVTDSLAKIEKVVGWKVEKDSARIGESS